jgi:pimeloyl-ACP methyl ester carboxylesterase
MIEREAAGWVGCMALLAGAVMGCSSSDSGGGTTPGPSSPLTISCADSADVFDTKPADLPGFDPSRRGDVVRCSPVGSYTLEQLVSTATALGYHGDIMTTGATGYKLAYRTERVRQTDGSTPDGLATATLFVPDKPRGGAGNTPLLVVGHGTVGTGARCAPSKGQLAATGGHLDDYRALVIPLVAAGWVVMAVDYAGYGYGSTTGYMLAEDVAHSVLDATRAASKVLSPGLLSGKVVFVGHSQGGHAVLAAQAYASTYGMDGTLAGVAAMAPLWFSSLAFGAMLSPAAGFKTADSPWPLSYSLEYFYTHGELIDGAGHGTDLFQPDKRDLVRSIATNDCLFEAAQHMPDLGAVPSDYMDQDFVKAMGICGLLGSCTGAAEVWGERCRADRPSIEPHGAPILIWQGGRDTTITPGLAVCGMDKLRADLASAADATTTVKMCVDLAATHSGFTDDPEADLSAAITRRAMDAVAQWIDARTLGGPEPADCEGEEAFATDAGPAKCTTPPPNE